MDILKFRVRGQALTLLNPNVNLIPVTDTVNQYLCQFEFSEDWVDLNKVVVFKNASYNITKEVYLSASNECYIPWEVLSNSGTIFLEVIGTEVRGNVVTVRIPSTLLGLKWKIQEGLLDVSANVSPTPDLFEQFVNYVREYSTSAISARDEALIAKDAVVQSVASASSSELAASSYAKSAENSASAASSSASSASEAALSVADVVDEARSYAEIASAKAADAATEAELAAGAKEYAITAKNDAESARDATLSAKETFDNNAETKLAAYNQNASEKTASYNTNANEKLNVYNSNAESKVIEYNQNCTNKTAEYNSNAETKLNEYNTNANNRVAEFDSHTEQVQTDISELKSDLITKADKTALDQTNLSLDALWKMNRGQTWDTQEAESNAYSVDVPSGVKYASVDMVGGKSVVWNQLCDKSRFPTTRTINGITFTNNGDGSITVNGTATDEARFNLVQPNKATVGHKSLIKGCPSGGSMSTYFFSIDANYSDTGSGAINSHTSTYTYMTIAVKNGTTVNNLVFKPQFIDITQMFRAGNEPSTVDDPRIKAIEEYADLHPEYNEGEIISSQTDRVDVKSSNLIYPNIPFIDRSGYTSSGVTYTYDENRVLTINGTRAENVSGSLGLFNYGMLSNGKYTLSVYDEHGNYASDVKINTAATPPYTFVVADSNHNSLITIVASISGKKYNNAKYYIKLEKGGKSTPYNPHIMQQITTNFPVLNSAGSVYDYIDIDNGKLHRRVGVVDLGTLNWTYHSSSNTFYCVINAMNRNNGNLLCSKYTKSTREVAYLNDMEFSYKNGVGTTLWFKNSAYTDATAFKAAMNGVMLVYELAEEIVTDITIPTELSGLLTVETGGSITFHNVDEGKRLLIPNKLSFVRKLGALSADEVSTMINESLGVIENGSY